MTICRTLHTTSILLFCAASISFAQPAEKTFVKSFNPEGNTNVLIDLPGAVEVKTWNSDVIRIQMTVTLPHGNEAMLTSLVEGGRYYIKSHSSPEGLLIDLPGLSREVKIRGLALEEHFSFIIYAPATVGVKLVKEVANQAIGLVD